MKRTRLIFVAVWLMLCLLVIGDFIENNYDSNREFVGNVESRIGFVIAMLALTFPSGFLMIIGVAVVEGIVGCKCIFGETPSIWESMSLWLAFVLAGYAQWFHWAPKLIKSIRGKNRVD